MKYKIGDIVIYNNKKYIVNYICYTNNVYDVKCIGILNIDNDTQVEIPLKDISRLITNADIT